MQASVGAALAASSSLSAKVCVAPTFSCNVPHFALKTTTPASHGYQVIPHGLQQQANG